MAATNRDLKEEVAAGRFRKDLFYRINGVRVVIPPLRERPEDIPLLVEHFARQLPNQKKFTPAALQALNQFEWPGNVRELHFAVERASLLSEGDSIDVADLPPEILERSGSGFAGRGASVSTSTPSPAGISDGVSVSDEDDDEEGPDLAKVRAALSRPSGAAKRRPKCRGIAADALPLDEEARL